MIRREATETEGLVYIKEHSIVPTNELFISISLIELIRLKGTLTVSHRAQFNIEFEFETNLRGSR